MECGWVAPSELYEGCFPELVAEPGFIKFLQGARVPVVVFFSQSQRCRVRLPTERRTLKIIMYWLEVALKVRSLVRIVRNVWLT